MFQINFKINHNILVRSFQIFNHCLLVVGLFIVWYFEYYQLLVISLLTYWIIGLLGINVGYHRLLSHRSFKTFNIVEYFLSLIGVITTVGSPLAWIAIHRQHHRKTETLDDPHSPYLLGNIKSWLGIWKIKNLDLKLIRDIKENKFQRFLHRYYFLIILTYCMFLYFIDPFYVIFVYAIPACLCLHSTSAIIVIAHKHGYKTFSLNDESRNSWIANLITLGEGWHNNHHAKPYAWSNWEHWWEWDVPSIIIRCIKK